MKPRRVRMGVGCVLCTHLGRDWIKGLGQSREFGAFEQGFGREGCACHAFGGGVNGGDNLRDFGGVGGPELPQKPVGVAAVYAFFGKDGGGGGGGGGGNDGIGVGRGGHGQHLRGIGGGGQQ